MQEMVYEYKKGQPSVLLNRGKCGDYEYLVISLGRHPCGYVCLPKDNKNFGKFYDDIDVDCHGGLTFSDETISFLEYSDKYKCMVKTSIKDKWIIGWDYAHYGDYTAFDRTGKRYSTQAITLECQYVIMQLITEEINDTIDRITKKVEENPTERNQVLLKEAKDYYATMVKQMYELGEAI